MKKTRNKKTNNHANHEMYLKMVPLLAALAVVDNRDEDDESDCGHNHENVWKSMADEFSDEFTRKEFDESLAKAEFILDFLSLMGD